MNDNKTLIENYVFHALPQGKVLDLHLLGNSFSYEKRFDAKGRVSFGRGREFDAYFLVMNSSLSLAALRDTITRRSEFIEVLKAGIALHHYWTTSLEWLAHD